MPAPFWGHLDPEREELTNALMRAQERLQKAQTRQMEAQTDLTTMIGAPQGGVQGPQRVGAPSETALRMEKAQMELMKPQYEKVGENWYVHYMGEPEAQLIAASPRTTETPYEIIERWPDGSTERIPKVETRPGEYMIRAPATGDMIFKSRRTDEVTRVVYNAEIKQSSQAEMIGAYAEQRVAGAREKEVEYDFQLGIRDLALGYSKLDATVVMAREGEITTRRGQDIQFAIGENQNYTTKWVAELNGQLGLAKIASNENMKKWGIISEEKMEGVRAAIQMGFLNVAQGKLVLDKYAIDKLDLRERDITAINTGLEQWKTQIYAGLQQQGIDINRFTAITGRMEAGTNAERNVLIKRKQDFDQVLGMLGYEMRGKELGLETAKFYFEKFESKRDFRLETAKFGLEKDKLKLGWYEAGYVPQTKEEVWELKTGMEKIEAMYAPYTQPNMMNEEHAYAYEWRQAGVELFMDHAQTDEKLRFELAMRGINMTPEDMLKWGALNTIEAEGMDVWEATASDYIKNLLFNMPETMNEERMGELEGFKAEKLYEHELGSPLQRTKDLETAWNNAIRMVDTGTGFFMNYEPEIQQNEVAARIACFKDILQNFYGYNPDAAARIADFQSLGEHIEAPTFEVGEGPSLSEAITGYKESLGAISGVPQTPLVWTPPELPVPAKGKELSTSDWREWYVRGFSNSPPATIKSVQQDLVDKGFLTEQDVTGTWDNKTSKQFRRAWNQGQLEYALEGME